MVLIGGFELKKQTTQIQQFKTISQPQERKRLH